jgi:hypothetical protein
MQVADDQRCPTLGEDLGTPGNGAVLSVRSHEASIAHPAFDCEVQILDFTAVARGGPMWLIEKGGRDDATDN